MYLEKKLDKKSNRNNLSHRKAMRISFIVIILILQISLVLGNNGDLGKNHPFIFSTNNTESKLSSTIASMPINYSNLTPAENKLSADLLEILYPEKVPWTTPENRDSVRQLFVKNKNETSWDSDAIFVTIVVNNGNSTHLVDPYIHLPVNRIEGRPSFSSWVNLSNIMNIANISEVRTIYIPPPALTNGGSVSSEGDTILHSQDVRALQSSPNGT